MSAQTVIHPSIESIKKEAEESFLINADKYLLEADYALGTGYCSFEQADAAFLCDIINYNNCSLLNSLSNEIERYEDSDSYSSDYIYEDYSESTSTDTLYSLWLNRGNTGTRDEFLTILLDDNKVNWASPLTW